MARQDVRVAEAALVSARARQADTVVVSALAGVVISRELEPGSTVNPGVPILKIADPASTLGDGARGRAGHREYPVGDGASIALRSQPGQTIPGRVVRIRRESDRVTEQLAVDIAFAKRPARLTFGEQAEAKSDPGGRKGCVGPRSCPLSALIWTPNGPAAFAVAEGRLRLGPSAPAWRIPRAGWRCRRGSDRATRWSWPPAASPTPPTTESGCELKMKNRQPTMPNEQRGAGG